MLGPALSNSLGNWIWFARPRARNEHQTSFADNRQCTNFSLILNAQFLSRPVETAAIAAAGHVACAPGWQSLQPHGRSTFPPTPPEPPTQSGRLPTDSRSPGVRAPGACGREKSLELKSSQGPLRVRRGWTALAELPASSLSPISAVPHSPPRPPYSCMCNP